MHLDIWGDCDIGSREDWNGEAEAVLFIEFVEIEGSVLQSEVAERACWLQATLDVALEPARTVFHAVVDIQLTRVFLFQALLL